jgi:peptidyl-prolyl cis-trans isomerase D
LAIRVSEEKSQADITNRFGAIKDDVMIPFANDYSAALDELEEARKQNPKATRELPTSPNVKEVAEREGMSYEITRLLSREEAEQYGPISGADVGTSRLSSGRKFAEELFDTKRGLFEPEELTDVVGMRFLVRKIKDVPPHIPDLSEVRLDVSLACKMRQARLLAQKAADDLAGALKKKGGTIKDETIEGFRVLTIPPTARRQYFVRLNQSDNALPEESPIPDVPLVGDAFRDAYFGLEPGSVAVAPNEPRTVFYVMTLDRREPATFDALYAPNSDEYRYKISARDQAAQHLDEDWMGWLRKEAGLKPDWIPPDELKKKDSDERS